MNTVSDSTEIVGTISVNPIEVEYVMGLADFRYPYTREAEQLAGWSKFAAIPGLFNWMVHNGHMPRPDEGVGFLLENVNPRIKIDARIKGRAKKLYLDFCRDMHSMGLLQRAQPFGYVQYQKSLDIRFNVDFVASLLSIFGGEDVGIQAAMRKNWDAGVSGDPFEKVKAQRRKRRGTAIEFDPSRIYWLTNMTRPPAKTIAGCWLFGSGHINDLVEEINGNSTDSGPIGVQQLPLF
jgi:hypothetical protein